MIRCDGLKNHDRLTTYGSNLTGRIANSGLTRLLLDQESDARKISSF